MKIEAVKLMRQLRAEIEREIAGLSFAEQQKYFQERSRAFDAWLEKRAAEPDS